MDQEERVKYLATELQDIQESYVKAHLERVEVEKLLTHITREYEHVCLELQGLQKDFLIQRRFYTKVRGEKMYWEEKYTKIAQVGRDNHKIITYLYQEYKYYKDKHEKLIFLANNLIMDIPRSLKDAENVMVPLRKDVEDFLQLCPAMVDGFESHIRRRT